MVYEFHKRLTEHNARRLKEINRDPADPYADDATEYGRVYYIRPNEFDIRIPATLDTPQQNVDFVPTLAITQIEYLSFIFDVADLVATGPGGGISFLPKQGDIILRENSNYYRVISFGEGQSTYQYITNNQNRVRVFTELIGVSVEAIGGPAYASDEGELYVDGSENVYV